MHEQSIVKFITTEIAPDVQPEEIARDYNLFDGGVLDSLAMVRLIAWIGETFGVPINDIDIDPVDLHSVRGIGEFIETHTPTLAPA